MILYEDDEVSAAFSARVADLRFSTWALASLRAVRAYIAEQDPAAAERVMAEIERACDLLRDFPQLGQAVPQTALRVPVTRRFRYRIVYGVTGDEIRVRDVLHPRRNWRRSL